MRHQESDLQRACVRWFRYQYPELRELLWSIPNERITSPQNGARMKAMGLHSGAPDLALYVSASGKNGLFIEMKSPTGRVTPAQRLTHDALKQQNYEVAVCRTFDQFKQVIEGYLSS